MCRVRMMPRIQAKITCSNGAQHVQAEGETGLLVPPSPIESGPSAPDAFFAETQLTYFDFVPVCVGIAQVAVFKEDTLLVKV